MKDQVLKLNANFVPIELGDWQKVLGDIVSGSAHPVDVLYAQNEDGSYNKNVIDSFFVIRSWKEWGDIEIRPCDDIVQTAKRAYKMPTIVVCANYKAVHHKKMVGPSAKNVHERDNYTCFLPGTVVVTDNGYKNIENIVEGNKVLNSGGFDKVVKILKNSVKENIIKIKSMGNFPLYVTKEHKILVHNKIEKKIKSDHFNDISNEDFIYKKAEDLKKGDLVITPKINHIDFSFRSVTEIDLAHTLEDRPSYIVKKDTICNYHKKHFDRFVKFSPELLFLMGLYAAEGNAYRNHFVFSLHSKEKYLIDKITHFFEKLNIPTKIYTRKESQAVQVMVFNSIWRDFFAYYTGHGCSNKFVHQKIFGLGKELIFNYISGLFHGDGHIKHENNKTILILTSKELIFGVKFLLNRFDIYPSFQTRAVKNKKNIYILILQGEDNYKFWKLETIKYKVSNKRYELTYNNYPCFATRITTISEEYYEGAVYDLSIENLPEYSANGLVVHNCCYTGKKLSKKELTLDHILPVSRGGKNTWENLVTCHKDLNVWKGNRTPEECGLKLLTKPTRPPNGLKFDYLKPEWKIFAGGKHE